MENQLGKQAGTRKERAAKGVKTQKMVSIRIDLDNLEWLNQQPNKGRYINDLIDMARVRAQLAEVDSE